MNDHVRKTLAAVYQILLSEQARSIEVGNSCDGDRMI